MSFRDATALELCGGLVLPLVQSLWQQQKWPELCTYLAGVTDALNAALSMRVGEPGFMLGQLIREVETLRALAKAHHAEPLRKLAILDVMSIPTLGD